MEQSTTRKPGLLMAFIPIIFLIILLGLNVIFYESDSSYGPNQIALLLSAVLAAILAGKLGYKWTEIRDGIVKSITSAMSAILILLLIGSLAGTWLISGVVPAMIYYGLQILSPTIFLAAACVISAVVSLATGSSWSTIATVGIALLGIGEVLGFNTGMVAGAIISGAYFGDKMSPLSDTTNLAPAMAGTDLVTHIKYMMYTTIPSIGITLLIFIILGFTGSGTDGGAGNIQPVLDAIQAKFYISPVLFLVPALVIFMIIKKVKALPALFAGTIAGAVFAIIFQSDVMTQIAGKSVLDPNQWLQKDGVWGFIVEQLYHFLAYIEPYYNVPLKAMFTEVSIDTNNADVNKLLSTKGMSGMMNTIWLIICAMIFGGVMEHCRFLSVITNRIIKMVKSDGDLVAATATSCLFFNTTASDQYLAIVVPGRMYAKAYEDRGLSPENLSRTLEDSGTVTSVLIPWNTCGAYQSGILGVATFSYLPYCFFNIISPLMTVFFAYAKIKIKKISNKDSNKETNIA